MSKKLMLLAAGALAVLAFSALPSVASAGTYLSTCEGAAKCEGTIAGVGNAELEDDGGTKIICTATGGTASFTSGTSTGSAQFKFTGCAESALGTSCKSSGAAAGEILTPVVTTDNVYLEPEEKTPGVLITNNSVTLICAGGLVKKTVTGNLLGELESSCTTPLAKTTVKFEFGATTGSQQWTTVTTTGTVFDLSVNNDTPEGTYTTAAQKGTGNTTWNHNVTLDC